MTPRRNWAAVLAALLVFLAGGCGGGSKGTTGTKADGNKQLPDLKPLPLPGGMGGADKAPPKAEPAPGNEKGGGSGVE